jgi:hypothetical protein
LNKSSENWRKAIVQIFIMKYRNLTRGTDPSAIGTYKSNGSLFTVTQEKSLGSEPPLS